MNYDKPELLDKLAAEYVLGTLHGQARLRFERLLRHLQTARTAVAAWNERLQQLAQSIPPIAPPARVWKRITTRLDARHAAVRSWPMPWLRTLASVVFGVIMGIGAVEMSPNTFMSLDRLAETEQALPQSYVGLLFDRDGKPSALASTTRHGNRMTLKILRPITTPAGQNLVLWALPRDPSGKALPPMRLGIIPAQGKGELTMSDSAEKLLSNVAQLGVSLEASGANLNTPGEFALTGHCVKLW